MRARITSGELMHPSNGVPWFFDAGADSLEFAYSGDMRRGVPAWERLREPRDLGAWLAERIDRVDRRRGHRPRPRRCAQAAWRTDRALPRRGRGRAALGRRRRHGQPLRGDARHPAGPGRRAAAGGRRSNPGRAGAVDARPRRHRDVRRPRRGTSPSLRRGHLPHGLPRRIAHQQPPLVLDGALRQPGQGAGAPRACGDAPPRRPRERQRIASRSRRSPRSARA